MSVKYYFKILFVSLFLAILEAFLLLIVLKLIPMHTFYGFAVEITPKLFLEIYSMSLLMTFMIIVVANFFFMPKEAFILDKLNNEKNYETGTVKWFNPEKGYGFILRDSGGEIFVHFRAIRGTREKFLTEGKRVKYTVSVNEKGMQAENVANIEKTQNTLDEMMQSEDVLDNFKETQA